VKPLLLLFHWGFTGVKSAFAFTCPVKPIFSFHRGLTGVPKNCEPNRHRSSVFRPPPSVLTSNNDNKESLTPFFTHRLKGKGMENLVVVLDERLHKWHPQIADEVKIRVAEIIDYADQGTLDLSRSRRVEQEVMDLIDED